MKIGFYPYTFDEKNSYLYNLVSALKIAVEDVELEKLPASCSLRDYRKLDYAWLNWFENLYSKNLLGLLKELLSKIIRVINLKIAGVSIITVLHNRQPHESAYPKINKLFHKLLLRCSDKIIILCDESREVVKEIVGNVEENKVCKVNHPIYICTPKIYPPEPIQPFTLAFVGAIRPYKNIELIIRLASELPSIRFIIAGKPISEEYGLRLKSLSQEMTNIEFKFGYLSNEEIENVMEESSLLLLPYEVKSSLNSGVVAYALSKGINVIIPKIGMVKELENNNLVFSYPYDKENQYYKIKDQVIGAQKEYNEDYTFFVNRAKKLKDEFISRFSLDKIAEQISGLNL